MLSLSTSHSFALDEVARYLRSATALDVLVQALLDAPLFGVRWRWNATTALALPRFIGGRKVAPQVQRMKSEDLLAAVFPDQVACGENLTGPRAKCPTIRWSSRPCTTVSSTEAMDADGWLRLLGRIEAGEVEVVTRDLPAPSPLASEALTARPYAYLDDAPIEERRTQAVQARRFGDAENVDEMGHLDADAIAAVCAEAWPSARNADEVHEALMMLGAITDAEATHDPSWTGALDALANTGRATLLANQGEGGERGLWVAAERLSAMRILYPQARMHPVISTPEGYEAGADSPDDALRDLLRSRLGGLGPVTVETLVDQLGLGRVEVESALVALQTEGTVFQGRISPLATQVEWCERHLLARIHRYTLKRLRREIEPVEPRDFVRFLFEWQHVATASRVSGPEALPAVLAQLEGFEAPAALWEAEVLPARVKDYAASWLDDLCTSGRSDVDAPAAGGRRHPGRWEILLARDARAAAAASRGADLGPPGRCDGCTGRGPGRPGATRRGLSRGSRRLVLRRDRRRLPSPACRTRGRARGTGRAGPRQLRQLCRPACIARAGLPAGDIRVASAPTRRAVRRRGRRALEFDSRARAAGRRRARPVVDRGDRTRGAVAAAPLWRRLLPDDRARGGLAAVVARAGAGVPPPGSTRRDPRRGDSSRG